MKKVRKVFVLGLVVAMVASWRTCTGSTPASETAVAAGNDQNDPSIEYKEKAMAFCDSPNFPKTCGFLEQMNNPKEKDVANSVCTYCGTVWTLLPKRPPVTVTGHVSYWQYLSQTISLACRGPTRATTVFKKVDGARDDCFKLDGLPTSNLTSSNITRCELILSESYENEDEAAINGREINCVPCSTCQPGTCPLEKGTWYKDTVEFTIPDECPPSSEPLPVSIIVDPQMVVRLAAFDIQSISS